MIVERQLTKEEIDQLIEEAPYRETKHLKIFLKSNNISAYDFFKICGIEQFGLLADNRPIYFAILTKNEKKECELWTIVNSGVKEIISLCKYSKRRLKEWVAKHKKIYATLEKAWDDNIKFTEWIGFHKIHEDKDTVTYCIKGE